MEKIEVIKNALYAGYKAFKETEEFKKLEKQYENKKIDHIFAHKVAAKFESLIPPMRGVPLDWLVAWDSSDENDLGCFNLVLGDEGMACSEGGHRGFCEVRHIEVGIEGDWYGEDGYFEHVQMWLKGEVGL